MEGIDGGGWMERHGGAEREKGMDGWRETDRHGGGKGEKGWMDGGLDKGETWRERDGVRQTDRWLRKGGMEGKKDGESKVDEEVERWKEREERNNSFTNGFKNEKFHNCPLSSLPVFLPFYLPFYPSLTLPLFLSDDGLPTSPKQQREPALMEDECEEETKSNYEEWKRKILEKALQAKSSE